ncbi:ABC transporter permease [Skermanella stibiiresistens SB22]|uniref:ABC transporter permease n=1 Tax=Skermanella stibiiresistens SB22 TaxID=1385369 RepID=W9GWM7_9PROT|nr:ABC transporter permease [Skermanella stibiiresistens]EWY38305.1 ABC transporter permease [Skermanella stibiiresistens SB22]
MTLLSASKAISSVWEAGHPSSASLLGRADPPSAATPLDLVDPTTVGFVPARRSRVPRWLQRLVGPVVIIAVWQGLSMAQLLDPRTTPGPMTVLNTAITMLGSGELQGHLWASLQRVLQGLAIGVSLGVVGALVAGLARWGENLIDANMEILHAVPNFAFLPVLIAWFGIGEEPKVALITLSVWIAIHINTYSAIRNVDASLVEAARTFGVGRRELITAVILPGALPGFLVGLRLALTAAWLALIFAETINAPTGLGRMMSDAREYFRIDVIFVLLGVYALLGLASLAVARFLESWLLSWRRSFDGA